MRTVRIGKDDVPVIGLGTWRVRDTDSCAAALEEGIRLGMTHIDTAELYESQSGSETMLGGLLGKAHGEATIRDRVFLASKVRPHLATRKGVVSACKDSLVRLGTTHLDLYYLHWRANADLGEALLGLADCQDAGWIRSIGVSNFDVEDLDEATAILGKGRIVANQVRYHLGDRTVEPEVVPWCQRHGVAVVAYSPLAAGEFPPGPGAKTLYAVARELGMTPRQVALAFVLRRPGIVTIPKTEQPRHVAELAGGARVLPPEAVARLEAAYPGGSGAS